MSSPAHLPPSSSGLTGGPSDLSGILGPPVKPEDDGGEERRRLAEGAAPQVEGGAAPQVEGQRSFAA